MQKVERAGRNTARGLRAIDVVLTSIAAGSAIAFGKQILELASSLEQARVRLAFFERGFDKANETFQELRDEFRGVPIDTKTMLDGFSRLKAAGMDPLDGSLKAIIDSVSAFGGGTDEINRAIIAIQQIAGKGVVSMEELRQQLGEAVPFAIALMARETERTIPEFIEAVSQGAVSAKEGIDAFIKGAKESFGGFSEIMANTLEGSQARIRQAWERLINKVFGQFGLDTRIGIFINAMAKRLDEFTDGLQKSDVERFVEILKDIVRIGAGAAQAVARLGQAALVVIETVSNAMGALGGDVIATGLIGRLFFGKVGAAIGIFFTLFDRLSDNFSGFVNSLTGMGDKVIGALGSAAQFGLTGFLLFGPAGGLVGAAFGLIKNQLASWIDSALVLAARVTDFLGFTEGRVERLQKKIADAAAGGGTVTGNFFAGLLGDAETETDKFVENTFEALGGWQDIRDRMGEIIKNASELNVEITDGTNNQKDTAAAAEKTAEALLNAKKIMAETAKIQRRINELGKEDKGFAKFFSSEFIDEARKTVEKFSQEVEKNRIKILQLQTEMLDATSVEKEAMKEQIATIERLNAKLEKAGENVTAKGLLVKRTWTAVGEVIETQVGDAISGLVMGTASLQDVMMSFWNAMTNAAVNYLVELAKIQLIQSSLGGGSAGGFGAALGSLFSGFFADGGVFAGGVSQQGIMRGPTAFGIGGEAGPEAVMPLERDGSGKLGVRASGAEGGMNVTIQIQAIDTQTGAEFLMKNMDKIVDGMRAEMALNNEVGNG